MTLPDVWFMSVKRSVTTNLSLSDARFSLMRMLYGGYIVVVLFIGAFCEKPQRQVKQSKQLNRARTASLRRQLFVIAGLTRNRSEAELDEVNLLAIVFFCLSFFLRAKKTKSCKGKACLVLTAQNNTFGFVSLSPLCSDIFRNNVLASLVVLTLLLGHNGCGLLRGWQR